MFAGQVVIGGVWLLQFDMGRVNIAWHLENACPLASSKSCYTDFGQATCCVRIETVPVGDLWCSHKVFCLVTWPLYTRVQVFVHSPQKSPASLFRSVPRLCPNVRLVFPTQSGSGSSWSKTYVPSSLRCSFCSHHFQGNCACSKFTDQVRHIAIFTCSRFVPEDRNTSRG